MCVCVEGATTTQNAPSFLPPRKEHEKMAQDRYYRFKCITYVKEETLRANLLKYADHYAYIRHDRDENEVHTHVLVTFKGNKSIKRVRELLSEGSDQNTLAEPIEDIEHDLEYLTHEDEVSKEQGKHRYAKEDITFDDYDYWTKVARDSTAQKISNEEFIDDLTRGIGFSHIEMAKKYGRDYIRNLRSYMYFRKIAMIEEGRHDELMAEMKYEEKVFGEIIQ